VVIFKIGWNPSTAGELEKPLSESQKAGGKKSEN
jgi:hypothetical protein